MEKFCLMKRCLVCCYFVVLVGLALETAAQEQLPVSFICIEAESGMVLMEENADLPRPPASMLKMMQMLLVQEGLKTGKWNYEMKLPVSALAQSMVGTRVFLAEGEMWPLGHLMKAIAVASANDASVVVAEGLWGSVSACLEAMNKRAEELGMTHTLFRSVNGLPPSDGVSFDQSSARDMATLGRALLGYPDVLEWTRMKEFAFRPDKAPHKSTNHLLERMPECDGLKTGYIRAAGFCLTATAKRDDVRLVAVVMGSNRDGRFTHTQKILEEGFSMVRRVTPVYAGKNVGKEVVVANGLALAVPLTARDNINLVVRKADLEQLKLEITAPTVLEAPVAAKAEVGWVRLVLGDSVLGQTALLTAQAVERKRLKHRFREFLGMDSP